MKNNRTTSRLKRHMRIRKNVIGTTDTPRLCVFRSLKNIEAQIIDDSTHKTLASASTTSLKIEKGGNIASAKLVGTAIAAAAKKVKITKVVFDRGGNLYHGRVKALAEAAKQKGLKS